MNLYKYENEFIEKGYQAIAGCDEVGRGPLAGPVVCAAVVLDPKVKIEGLNDSKKLSEKKRELLDKEIRAHALAYHIVYIYPEEIDRINIYQASKKGMMDAVRSLSIVADFVLSDAMPLEGLNIPYLSIIKGDSKSASIAAASIIAKVSRDHYMLEQAKEYPLYGFEKHKGYPTKKHLEALVEYGVLPIHRKTYKPVYDRIHIQEKLNI